MPGRGVTDARFAGGNTATQIYDRDEKKKEDIKTQPTIEMPTDTKFEDMYRKAIDSPMSSEDTTKMRKRHNRRRALAAIIDGVSALGNVYFAKRGAGANGTTNFSGAIGNRWREYWDKVRTDRDAYNKGLLQAQQMDYNAKLRRLERAEDKAERKAERAEDMAWKRQLREDDRADKAQTQSNWKMTFDANEAQRAEQNTINLKQLEIAQQNATTAANKTKGEYMALDEEGNEHLFTDKKAADDFALQHGTHTYQMVEKTITEPDPYTGELKTKTIKEPVLVRNGKTQKKANPMGTDKKPNPMK